MKTTIFVAVALAILLIPASFALDSQKRFIANSDEMVSQALLAGCTIQKETKQITVLLCDESITDSLKLTEDVQLRPTDSGANIQIQANKVQVAGISGNGRSIVLIDSGIDYTHPELSARYKGGYDFVNTDSDPFDDYGHGTHVAGIVASAGINAQSKGVAPNVNIYSAKVVSASGVAYLSDVVRAIYWAVDGTDGISGTADDPKADAISISLGTNAPYVYKNTCDTIFPELVAAITYANQKGVVVVSSAGNNGANGVSAPGCASNSITVGAVDAIDKIASFSGTGSAVDLVAPGVSIYSTTRGGNYAYMSGTSQAAPMVAATVALMREKQPTMSASQVQSALFSSAKKIVKRTPDLAYGYGRLDAYTAVFGSSTGGKPGRK